MLKRFTVAKTLAVFDIFLKCYWDHMNKVILMYIENVTEINTVCVVNPKQLIV